MDRPYLVGVQRPVSVPVLLVPAPVVDHDVEHARHAVRLERSQQGDELRLRAMVGRSLQRGFIDSRKRSTRLNGEDELMSYKPSEVGTTLLFRRMPRGSNGDLLMVGVGPTSN